MPHDLSAPGIGHNGPPDAVALFRADLAERTSAYRARLSDLAVGLARVPAEIVTADEAARVMDFIAQCRGALRDLEDARKAEAKPVDAMKAAIQAEFKGIAALVDAALEAVVQRVGRYHARVQEEMRKAAEAERARAREAARLAAEEADALKREADERARQSSDRAAARQAQQAAAEATAAAALAAEAAEAPMPTGKARTRGEYGATGYSKSVWVTEVVDPMAIPREFLMVDEAAVRDEISRLNRSGQPVAIPGFMIRREQKFIVVKGATA